MNRPLISAVLSFLSVVMCLSDARAAEISVERTRSGAKVLIDGDLFTEYLTRSGSKPVLWPVIGPTEKAMTRSYPVGPLQEGERDDHIHHRSFWFTHGIVNDLDFWLEPKSEKSPHGLIVHRDFVRTEAENGQAVIVTKNDWVNGVSKEKVCEDTRRLLFGANDRARWIDFTITIHATNGPVTFGDTKEGTFGVRVAGSMKVDAEKGGRIVNARGQVDKEAWGQAANWVDYVGPVEGETLGVALFSHPSNFRHPCRWHVRTYGLFTANPFGLKDFPQGEPKQGAYTIAAGDSLKLRYLVHFHRGGTEEAGIAQIYEAFAGKE